MKRSWYAPYVSEKPQVTKDEEGFVRPDTWVDETPDAEGHWHSEHYGVDPYWNTPPLGTLESIVIRVAVAYVGGACAWTAFSLIWWVLS